MKEPLRENIIKKWQIKYDNHLVNEQMNCRDRSISIKMMRCFTQRCVGKLKRVTFSQRVPDKKRQMIYKLNPRTKKFQKLYFRLISRLNVNDLSKNEWRYFILYNYLIQLFRSIFVHQETSSVQIIVFWAVFLHEEAIISGLQTRQA